MRIWVGLLAAAAAITGDVPFVTAGGAAGLFSLFSTAPAAAQTPAPPPLVLGPAPSIPPAPAVVLDPASLPGLIAARLASPVAAQVSRKGERAESDREDLAAAQAFYAARRYVPLWVSDAGLTARANRVIAEIERAGTWGLDPTSFALPARGSGNPASREALSEAELTLTRSILKYARHARGGRIPDPTVELSAYLDRKPQLIAPAKILDDIAASATPDEVLASYHPRQREFVRLRQAYVAALASRGQLAASTLPPGPTLMPGRGHPHVAILRRRLNVPVSGDALSQTGNPAEMFDPALAAAVRAFQTQAGLRTADGRVGEKTRAALNANGSVNTDKLLANMEQWRWMPESLGDTYVNVNIPEFSMRLVRDGRVVHTERVVTGKTDTATPSFSDMMETVVFQPKWGVPDSIKVNELLPRLQSGRGLKSGLKMELNGREINPWSVDWSRADILRYHIYQPSGDDNALGVVKFLFPNKHAVYMHDTPSKGLFNAQSRAFSHGCVRVRDPIRLAELVLGADKAWDGARVRELVTDGPENNAVKLDRKIPVHLTYFTVTVDEAGVVKTFPDVYGHEKRITLALSGRPDLISKLNPPPLAPRPAAVAAAAPESGTFGDGSDVQVLRPSAPFKGRSTLGFAPPPPPPPPTKSGWQPTNGSRFRGNSTNDIIMRSLGGY
jgi:L,D-transpeptidase YcbB